MKCEDNREREASLISIDSQKACETVVELLKLLGGHSRSIPLATTAGNPIANEVQVHSNPQHAAGFAIQLKKFRDWEVRKEPCGIYNCFGHIWASRRTAILEDEEVEKIRLEDRYNVVGRPKVGDLVVYFHFHHGKRSFDHVARVTELRELAGSGQPIPWVISKLGSGGGEVIHKYNSFPDFEHCEIEYWTDRS